MRIVVNQKILSRFYSVILAWIPLLGIYRSFVPGVSIGEFVLLICSVFSLIFFTNRGSYRGQRILQGFAIYSIVTTIVVFLLGEYEFFWLHRLIRIVFYIFCICYVSKKFFDVELFFRSAYALAYVLFIGIIVQYLVYYTTGIYIRLFGNILPLMENELLNLDYQYIIRISVFRPSSFFTEPSHVAQYMIIPFIYSIYNIDVASKRKSVVTSTIFGLTILLSKSLWGYAILAVILIYWILDSGKEKHSAVWYLVLPVLLIFGTFILTNSAIFRDTFSRINIFDLGSSQSFTGRFGGYDILTGKSLLSRIFGSGFAASVANRPITNSVLLLLYGSGYLGSLIICLFFVSAYANKSWNWQRTLGVALFVLMFGSNIFFSTSFILICTCLAAKENKKANGRKGI